MVINFQNPNSNPIVSKMSNLLKPIIENELDRHLIIESLILKFNIDTSSDFQFKEEMIVESGDGSTFNFKNGHIRLSSSFILNNFLKNVFYLLTSIFLLLLPTKTITQKRINILYGFESQLVRSENSTAQLVQDLSNDKLSLINKNDFSIFENREFFRINRITQTFYVTFDAGLFLMRSLSGFKDRLRLVILIVNSSISKVYKYRLFNLLGGDRLIVSIPVWLSIFNLNENKKEIRLISTQSNLSKLPASFFLQDHDRSVVWYSNNSLPFRKVGEIALSNTETLTSQFIDRHFVWSQSHADFLKLRYPNSEIMPVGPIVFNSQFYMEQKLPNNSNKMIYFDVTPFENLNFSTFYSEKICLDTLKDISDVSRTLNIDLSLKPKRPYLVKRNGNYIHSSKYLQFLKSLEVENLLERVKFDESIYDLIFGSRVVIGTPYTSPVFIAKSYGIESIYYIPEDIDDWDFPTARDGIPVIRGKEQLFSYLQKIFPVKN